MTDSAREVISWSWSTRIVYGIAFLSGAAALTYQISWSRQLGLVVGHTADAAAVILSSYFAGLALGYVAGAYWPEKYPCLLGAAVAEIGAAVWSLLLPSLLQSYVSIADGSENRAVLCFAAFLPATALLGATLPLTAKWLADGECVRLTLPRYYAFNTAGAFAGVLLTTFYFLLHVGVTKSSYLAAAVSLSCGVALIGLYLTDPRVRLSVAPETNSDRAKGGFADRAFWSCVSALCGLGIMALEVLYTRLLSLVSQNSIYTFGACVATILAALSVGAALVGSFGRHNAPQRTATSAASIGAASIMASIAVFVRITNLQYLDYGQSFAAYLGMVSLLLLATTFVPFCLLGMLLPVAWQSTLAAGRDSWRAVGCLSAWNSLACAAGAYCAGFLLIPAVGLWVSLATVAVMFYVLALASLWRCQNKSPRLVGVVVFSGLIGGSSWIWLGASLEKPTGERLVRRWNSAYGLIDVVRADDTGVLKVRQNLHYRFGTTGASAERAHRQAHLPLLLHNRPKDVLFLGLGTGLTAGGAVPHAEVKHIVAVELVPEVVEAARLLAADNFGVVDDAKVMIEIDDARHYLRTSSNRFDVIVSDLFVPFESQSGYLYTLEHYRIARDRLQAGGLFCQWLPLYQLGIGDFETIAQTFATAFPNTSLWWGNMDSRMPIVALIGTQVPLTVDTEQLRSRLGSLEKQIGKRDDQLVSSTQIMMLYAGDWISVPQGNLNTDEYARVELLSPIAHRNGQLLSGTNLKQYFSNTITDLPHNGVRASVATDFSSEFNHAWQRFILFGSEQH